MRIGILTFHFAYNYGAMLQAYALSTYLSMCGHEVKIINYFPDELKHLYSINPLVSVRKKEILEKIKKIPRCLKQYRRFEEFKNKDLLCTERIKRDDLIKCNDFFDTFIVGSDQVWNDDILIDINPYLLSFVSDKKVKISYAASFGKESLSDNMAGLLKKALPEFNAISVREKWGVLSLKSLGIDAIEVADPVFLLEKKYWCGLSRYVKTPERFLLCYSLERDIRIDKEVQDQVKQKDIPAIIIHSTCERIVVSDGAKYLYNIGPREFLYLILNAEVIITNSFHATAFSIILDKEVINISSRKRMARAKNLLNGLHCSYLAEPEHLHYIPEMETKELIMEISDSAQFFLQCILKENGDGVKNEN